MEKMDLNEIRILANSILFNNENFKLNEDLLFQFLETQLNLDELFS